MTNIDVSKLAMSSQFPTLINFDKVQFSFDIPSQSISVPVYSSPYTTALYTYEGSIAIDRNNAIADVLIGYSGGEIYVSNAGVTYYEPYKLIVKGAITDFYSEVLDSNGKNRGDFVGTLGSFPTSISNYFGLNIWNWFDNGRMYTRVSLYYHRDNSNQSAHTATWAGGTITTEASLSLLPY